MKSSIRKSTYKAIYRLLDRVSPIKTDCGLLCDSACCRNTEGNMGIYLLPGEEKLFSRKEAWLRWDVENAEDYEFPDSWHGKIYFLTCLGPAYCHRKERPLQCRFFPLAPHITRDGKLVMIIFPLKLPYECPLIQNKTDLEPSFVKAVHTVWARLVQDPLIRDLVLHDSNDRDDTSLSVVSR